jgi:hypothetical protein
MPYEDSNNDLQDVGWAVLGMLLPLVAHLGPAHAHRYVYRSIPIE